MKSLFMLTLLAGLFAVDALAAKPELLIDKQLPKIGNEWLRRNDAGTRGDHSWVNFDNKKSPGDVLSFVATKVPPMITVTSSSVNQASIEMFLDNGSAAFSSSKQGQPISDTVRHRVVSINIGSDESKHEIEAIEYTYIYERDGDNPIAMAHGYCVVVENTAIFVQHTSLRAISSEVVFEVLGNLLSKQLQLVGKPHSFGKGKILKSNG